MIDSRDAYTAIRQFKQEAGNGVRQEQSGERNLEFSQWLRDECRASKRNCKLGDVDIGAFVVFDLDFIIYDYQRKIMQLLEVKTRNGRISFSQKQTLGVLDAAIRHGAQNAGITYLGLHLLKMDGLTPYDSKRIEWNDRVITKAECWRKINMIDSI